MTACAKYLHANGWRSNDTIVRARRELIDCGLLIETRKGARPNKAAWFALSWLDLDQGQDLDIEPKHYRRGEYVRPEKPASKNAALVPSGGTYLEIPPAPSGGGVRWLWCCFQSVFADRAPVADQMTAARHKLPHLS